MHILIIEDEKGIVDFLKQGLEEKINFCISEVDRLNHMVDQLLLLARFENQKQNLKSESVYLNALILDLLARFSDKIKNNKIVITTNFSKEYSIASDMYLVTIIISNLLSNAIKYTHSEGKISLLLFEEEESIQFSIIDNGIGIAPNDIAKVFQSFYRSESSNQATIKGTGLGLSIVKRLCDLLQIKISIESELNVGTVINLSFPSNKIK
jgi:signal transduction histidine kinase